MPNDDVKSLLNYIDKIITATSKGDMVWSKANPSTFIWQVTEPRDAKVVIQRVERRAAERTKDNKVILVSKHSFVFLVIDSATNKEVISVEGRTLPEVDEKLKRLFEVITLGLTKVGFDFLDEVLPIK